MLTTRRFFHAIPSNPELQISADSLVAWTEQNHMCVNESKTKEMLIYFGTKHNPSELARIHINLKEIERVESFKLLGLVLSSDLSWSEHVDYMLRKVAKRMHCIHYLVRCFNYSLFSYSNRFGICLSCMASWSHSETIR